MTLRLDRFMYILLLLALPALAQAPAPLRAGAAKSDISRVEQGLRINDPVCAKALVLEQGDTKVAIIAMDVTAIGGIG